MRAIIKNAISAIRNQKKEHQNTRFVVADVLDSINNEKYGAEDTYTKTEINNLIAGTISGEFVPLAGTTATKPITGGLFGQPKVLNPAKIRNFNLGKLVSGDDNTYGLVINSDSIDNNGTGYRTKTEVKDGFSMYESRMYNANILTSMAINKTSSIRIEKSVNTSSFGTNSTVLEDRRYYIGLFSGGNAVNYFFDETGISASKFLNPASANHFVQKQYVDNAITGVSGFIPLAGSTGITGGLTGTGNFPIVNDFSFVQKQYVDNTYIPIVGSNKISGGLIGTSYFLPTNPNAFVQKSYVDTAISNIPAPTGFIPLTGSSSISGGLTGNGYFTPANELSFVQKRYVDTAISNIPAPTGFIPLTGSSSISGGLTGTIYFAPTNDFSFVQKKYVDDAVSGATPTGFIPLTGANNITGGLTGTGYFAPANGFSFVQKQYVDTAISNIPAPTGFIPLTGANNITGGLTGTGYFAPANGFSFVQKQYVDDKFNLVTNYIPMTGTVDATPATGKIEIMKDNSNYVRIGTPNGTSGSTGSAYGIQTSATDAGGDQNNLLSVDVDGFNWSSLHNTSGDRSAIVGQFNQGVELQSTGGRGDSKLKVFTEHITGYVRQDQGQPYVEFEMGMNGFYSTNLWDWNTISDKNFIQKRTLQQTGILNRKPHETAGIFHADGADETDNIYCVVIPFTQQIGQSDHTTIDLKQYNVKEIVKIEGKVRDAGNKGEYMLNAPHHFSSATETILNGSLYPTHIRLIPYTGDVQNTYGWIYLYYTQM